ncbi:MAG: alanine racemase [Sporomusaceae bacterium]|nr:alanine racemase [Sporomusaceae bacterium]
MSHINELHTPAFLVDMDKVEKNIAAMASLCKQNGKKLCPMVKTHKSAQLAAMQAAAGVDGFLAGTLDEAEMLAAQGHQEVVLAYPVAAVENISRVITLAQKTRVVLSLDGFEAAAAIEAQLAPANLILDYLIIIDCGLGRFGVQPEQAAALAAALQPLAHLRFKGIGTHPGHVYGKSDMAGVAAVAAEEVKAVETAAALLTAAGFSPAVVATGSTPTAALAAKSSVITTLRPGNYVFHDAIQVALGVVPAEQCALSVLATVIANPRPGLFMIDAGSKCFGLDKGAHGVALLNGFGLVKGHPELVLEGLSEEVGKLRTAGETTIAIGDKIEIIPNHSCSSANMTSFLVCHRGGAVEGSLAIDARSSSRRQV